MIFRAGNVNSGDRDCPHRTSYKKKAHCMGQGGKHGHFQSHHDIAHITHLRPEPKRVKHREILAQAFEKAIARCQADRVLADFLPEAPDNGRLIILGAGKAAGQMAEAAERHYVDHVSRRKLRGLIVVPDDAGARLRCLDLLHASHPVPDERSEHAARRMLQAVRGLAAEDLVVMLLSGGASSLLCAPATGISLSEKRAITEDLLACGATIDEINIVRSCFSDIKGGKLSRACWPASVTTLAVSDVVGDQPEVIGSGLTVDVSAEPRQVRDIVDRYDLPLSENLSALLDRAPSTTAPPFPTSEYKIIVRPMDALLAAASVVRQHGYESVILGDAIEGEARKVASTIAGECGKTEYHGKKVALLSGGEVTVTIDKPMAEAYGGSNREFALALAAELPKSPHVAALIADTDGIDGQIGANGPVAGAFVDSSTVTRGAAMGLDIQDYLAEHRSGHYFAELQDELITGPTDTNVNDFRALLIN